MSSTPVTRPGAEAASSPDAASGVRDVELTVSLSCPECGHGGYVQWNKLKRGMRCPKCQCQFLLDRNGQLQTQDQLPQIRFDCPRCGQTGSIPKLFNVRKALCGVCKLPLVLGPDQQLHGLDEVARMRREAKAAARHNTFPGSGSISSGPAAAPPSNRRRIMAGGAALVVILAVGAWWMASGSPHSRVSQFTSTCLTGRWNDCYAFLPDDDVATAEFDRWRIRYFPSIIDKVRPQGDTVEIEVSLVRESASERVYEVTLQSPFVGTRTHEQIWIHDQGQWWFDPAVTLRASDGQ